MDTAEYCRCQAQECRRLLGLPQSEAAAQVLRNLCHSWLRVANQADRYAEIVRRERGAQKAARPCPDDSAGTPAPLPPAASCALMGHGTPLPDNPDRPQPAENPAVERGWAVDHQRKDDREFHAVWVERLRAPDRRRCGPRPLMKVLWGHHIALRDLISDPRCLVN